MGAKEPRKPILLLGAYGRGNLGDDVFISCAVNMFHNKQIFINSADDSLLPEHVRKSVHTLSTTKLTDIFTKIATLVGIREVTYWGGDFWVELHGTHRPRLLLYKMVLLNALFRISGKRVNYIGCGIGDLKGYSFFLAKLSSRMANTVIVREHRSAKILKLPANHVFPDIAVNLGFNRITRHKRDKHKPPVIVISPLWWIPEPQKNFDRFIKDIAQAIDQQKTKCRIVLLPMQISDSQLNDDLVACKALKEQIRKHPTSIFLDRNLEAVIKLLRDSDIVLGVRLHASILAILNGTPTMGIAYRPKVREFFNELDLSDYCLDYDQLEELPQRLKNLLLTYDKTANKFYTAAQNYTKGKSKYSHLIANSNVV